jgi:hypothetical protein
MMFIINDSGNHPLWGIKGGVCRLRNSSLTQEIFAIHTRIVKTVIIKSTGLVPWMTNSGNLSGVG